MRVSLPLDRQCALSGVPVPAAEVRFHPTRRWRFDWCWADAKLALEVQGGIYMQGRHTRGAALVKEFEKLNAAATMGWRVLFVTPRQVANGEALAVIAAALGGSR